MTTLTAFPNILAFEFNPYALLSLVGILVNLALIYLILSRGIQNSANRWFTTFLFALVVWGISEFMGRLSSTAEMSQFWGYLGAPGFVFMPIFFFNFALAYVGKESWVDGLFKRFLIFGSGVVFLFLSWVTDLIGTHDLSLFIKEPWGWGSTVTPSLFIVFIVWLESFFITALVLLIRYFQKVNDESKRRQTLLIIVALLVPLIGGSLTDALFPILNISVPGTAILLTSVLGAITTYAILKYKLFVINPATHVANIVQTMNEALLVFNLGNVIEFTNQAVEKLFGFNQNELLGRRIQILIKNEPDLTAFENNFLKAVSDGGTVNGLEMELTSKTGEAIPVSLSGSLIKDQSGNRVGFVVLASDMREIKKLIYSMSAERNKLSITLTGIADGVFVVDKDGIISYFNPAAERIFGLTSEQTVGKRADEILNVSDDDGKILIQYFFPKEKLSKDMVTFSRNDVRIIRPSGETVYANLIASNIVEGEEVNLGAIVTLHDVSKEKDLEEMKLDFVSMAAHELRTPLTSIRGYLSVLQEEVGKTINAEQASFLDKAFISSTQLAALVENLLSVSRIEKGSLQIQAQTADWEKIIEEAYNNFLPQAKERKLTFTNIKPKEKLPLVLVDKFRISEVISNLIANAQNYTPAGGSVEVSTELKDNQVLTHVKDSGQGIPEAAISKLFTKFFRVSGVLEQGSKGTGLGLYISKSIVDMHKGRIWVESKIGQGSVFSFSVPVSPDQTLTQTSGIVTSGKKMFMKGS